MRNALGLLVLTTFLLAGCRSTYYTVWEQFGKYKRDLLKDNVEKAKDEQKQAAQEFKDALTRLKELYNFEGGDLEKVYRRLQADYDSCAAQAAQVRSRIQDMDQVANDLFKEWETEIGEISNARLKADSQTKLRQTKARYEDLHSTMVRAEKSMDPVLTQLHDQVLYLKHNLNAQAIGALKGEALDIEKDIQGLIENMNASIREAERFIETLPKE